MSLSALLLTTSPPPYAHSQVEWKDNYGPIAEGDQTNPAIARPSQTTYTIVVWEDQRDASTWHTDIYAQKYDNTNGLPQWTPADGVPVCTAGGDQKNPRAAYDSLGNVIVVWEDYRGDSSQSSIYANCLSVGNGSINGNWGPNGRAVCDTTAHAEHPRIVGTGDGAYIAWVDWRNSLSQDPDSLNRDIYLQYVMSASGGWPQGSTFNWVSCGVLVPDTSVFDDTNVELDRNWVYRECGDSLYRDGVHLVFQSRRALSNTTTEPIYMVIVTQFDGNGTRQGGYELRCADSREQQLYPRVRSMGRFGLNGDNHVWVTWMDFRSDPTGPNSDIYAQQLDRYQQQVSSGSSSGIIVCDDTGIQRYPELSLFERQPAYSASVICVWEDLRNSGSTGVDVYAGVLDGENAALLSPGATDGIEVCTNAGDQTQVRVDNHYLDAESYIVWRHGGEDGGASGESDIWYQSMDLQSLDFSQPDGVGRAVTRAKAEQTTPQVGGAVFVWADRRREEIPNDSRNDWNIYLETPGYCVGETEMRWRDMWADVTVERGADHMRIAVDEGRNTFVVWQELGLEDGHQNVYIQKLDATGVPRWENSGIRLNTSVFASEPEVTISDSIGGAQVAWQQTTGGTDSVYYAKISPVGEVNSREVCEDCRKPVIAYADSTMKSGGIAEYPAYIGVIPDAGEVKVYSWDTKSQLWTFSTARSQIEYEDIIIDATTTGDFFLAGWEAPQSPGQLQVVWGTAGSVTPLYDKLVDFDFFGGCDISADRTGRTVNGHAGGFIVYSAQLTVPDPVELYAHVIKSDTTTLPVALQLTNTLPWDGGPTHPAMCQDSSVNATGFSGMLVAWDLQYRDQFGQQRHQVTTNKLEYVSVSGVNLIRWSHPYDVTVSASMPHRMQPDIARLPNTTPAFDTLGIVVWDGITEECTPSRPREIVAQWVKYDSAALDRGVQWGAEKTVGPGPGSYMQTHPIVKNSEGNNVNVFWCDDRSGVDMAIGTRFHVEESDRIWLKPQTKFPSQTTRTIHLGASYPNPLSLLRTTVSNIEVDLASANTVSLRLYDNLGRQVGVVYEGPLLEGRHVLRFDASRLSAGLYHYLLRSADALVTRGLVIVR